MFLDDPKTRKALTKWAVGTVAACILIFLGVRYISSIALAIEWLVSLVKPLLIGSMLAMILSVPWALSKITCSEKIRRLKKKKQDVRWQSCFL